MIFLTGGTGFLGRYLVAALCRAGWPVRLLSRYPQRYAWLQNYPNLEIIQGDLRSAELVHDAMAGCTHVIHAAGLFSMWDAAGDFNTTNVQGTQHVVSAALAHQITRLIFVSTIAVIGQPIPDRIIDETHPARPADPYQQSKLDAEGVVLDACKRHQLAAIILRPGAFYGPLGNYAFNRLFFTDPMRGIIMQMDGGYYQIFPAYIADVADAIVLALDRGTTGEIYNICGDHISHREAFDIICQAAGLSWPRLNIPGWIGINFARLLTAISRITRREPFYPTGLRSYVFNHWRVSSAKAQAELGFVPTTFTEGARRTVAWYQAGKPDHVPEVACDGQTGSHYQA